MRPRLLTIAITAASCAVAIAAAATGPVSPAINLPSPQLDVLSGMDVPITGQRGKDLIESAFGAQPLSELIAVARDTTEDAGIRLRAYRAIGLYQAAEARTALTEDLAAMAAAPPGVEMLYLRAAIESLGQQHDPVDVATLVPFLDFEASRDIRATTADALRHIGAGTAIDPLRERYARESSNQVRLAISRALRDLGQPQ